MTWIQAVNDTNKTVYVQRASPIGLLMSSLKILSIGGVAVRRRSVDAGHPWGSLAKRTAPGGSVI
ncbi:hypothetical protein N7527_008644 [Penicillium freii]|nr:hypothetical protein N7527_008644 [Penicillium freii]